MSVLYVPIILWTNHVTKINILFLLTTFAWIIWSGKLIMPVYETHKTKQPSDYFESCSRGAQPTFSRTALSRIWNAFGDSGNGYRIPAIRMLVSMKKPRGKSRVPCGTGVILSSLMVPLIPSIVTSYPFALAFALAVIRLHLDKFRNLHPYGDANRSGSCSSFH